MKQIEKSTTNQIDVQKLQTYLNAMGMSNNLNQNEFQQFVEIAQAFGLNPFKREIYASKYGENFSIIVGFETYIKRAERSGLLSGWHVETFGAVNWQQIEQSTLLARITIHRKDFDHPFIHDVHFIEYVGRKRDGSVTKFWKEKPITMTKKVAIAQGFRMCFSDELGGMPYTKEEMSTMDVDHVVVDTKKPVNKLNLIIESIMIIESIDGLKSIWDSNVEFQNDKQFKHSINKRKKELEPAVVVETKTADPIVDQVMAATTTEQIFELVADEKRPDVLKVAREKMDDIIIKENSKN
jgi:phage recombination protein Bet